MKEIRRQTDETLVRQYMSGNNAAFDTLIRRYESKVFTYLQFSVHNTELAEDLFQDVFMKVIDRLRNGYYIESGKFSAWIMRITRNAVIDYYRVSHPDHTFLSNDDDTTYLATNIHLADTDTVESQLITLQTNEEVKWLISQLPTDQRDVVLMRYYQDLSFKEIADITSVSINTALGRMRYALLNLRKMASQHGMSA